MNRRGMTLVEMMVATTMTLIIMGIIAQLFGILGNSVSGSRTTLDMSQQLRAVANTLRTDLAGVTVETSPPVAADSDSGYLEIIEGQNGDFTSGTSSLTGDCDDILMFTTRSLGSPFVGKFNDGLIESPHAEIVWFCLASPAAMQTAPGTVLYTLYRRQLLAMDYVGAGAFQGSGINSLSGTTIPSVYETYDISMRSDATRLYPNSLGDLTKRENRFMHNPTGLTLSSTTYPYNSTAANIASDGPLAGMRAGEDIVMTNILSFDVRVYDAKAPIRSVGTIAVTPGDPGYASGTAASAEGAYVDLNWNRSLTASLSRTVAFPPTGQGVFEGRGVGVRVSGTSHFPFNDRIYDTWSTHYESNGINEGDGPNITAGTIDEGTNGIDDNGDGVIDDAGEMETSPPYPTPLRGLEVRIRCYEPQSRQVRQITVRHTFVPH